MPKQVLIIGGGAAGMLAALFAARGGAAVTLLERNEKLGKKVYITGKGRCNLTNAAEPEPFMRNIFRNPRFLYSSLAVLNNIGIQDLIEGLGVPLKVERGDRVFPTSDRSSDIIRALERELRRLGVMIRFGSRVRSLLIREGTCRGAVLEDGTEVPADAVVLATGGLSYPQTGSDGDGHRLCRELGMRVTKLLPALCPIETVETWPYDLTGLSLKNVALRAYQGKKRFFSQQGEMLLTHFGISGPLVLTLSSLLPEDLTQVRLSLDLKPAMDDEMLDKRLLRELEENPKRTMASVADTLVPHALGLKLLELAGIAPSLPASQLDRAGRTALRLILKDIPLHPAALRGFGEAIITRGGVDVRCVDPSTMACRTVPGLYLAGELLDVDAATGGFNLQIAWSTGALAGRSAAMSEA